MRKTLILALFAGLAALVAPAEGVLAQNEQFFPALVYRSGPYAPNGIPFANGYGDYLRPGQRARRRHQRRQDHDRGVRDRLRHRPRRRMLRAAEGQGPDRRRVFVPLSTGITYALMDKAPADKIPLLTSGYGRSESADGNVVPLGLPDPRHLLGRRRDPDRIPRQGAGRLGQAEGQEDRRRLHDSPYGKEPIPVLQEMAKQHGFDLELMPVTHPGVEQKATWLQIRQSAARFRAALGLGRDELDGAQGGGGRRLSARQDARRVVGRRRGRYGAGRGRREGLQGAGAQPDRVRTSRCTPTSSSTSTTRISGSPSARMSGRCCTTAA